MRFFGIEFTDVPEDEYANLAEVEFFGLRSEPDGLKTGYMYLSDVSVDESSTGGSKMGLSYDGGSIRIGGEKYLRGIGVSGNSDVVFNLAGDASGYQRGAGCI